MIFTPEQKEAASHVIIRTRLKDMDYLHGEIYQLYAKSMLTKATAETAYKKALDVIKEYKQEIQDLEKQFATYQE